MHHLLLVDCCDLTGDGDERRHCRKGPIFLIKMKIMIFKIFENEAKTVSSRGV
jgi:hypothetical protein